MLFPPRTRIARRSSYIHIEGNKGNSPSRPRNLFCSVGKEFGLWFPADILPRSSRTTRENARKKIQYSAAAGNTVSMTQGGQDRVLSRALVVDRYPTASMAREVHCGAIKPTTSRWSLRAVRVLGSRKRRGGLQPLSAEVRFRPECPSCVKKG